MSRVDLGLPPGADPHPGVSFPLVLRREPGVPAQGLLGVMAAFLAFVVVVPLVAQAVTGVGFAVSGGGDWEAFRVAAGQYRLPIGPAASNLALATLIPVSLLIVRFVHGVRTPWAISVWPGMRWRYWVIALFAAAVVLNAMLWLRFLVLRMPTFHSGQDGWVWFVVAVVLTSPLQAAAEEVFFRGYLLQAIGSATGRAWAGVVGSAVIFALLHGVQNPALFAHRLAFGLIAGALVVVTGGLEAGIAAHIVNNLGAYGYALFTSSLVELKAISAIGWADAVFDIAGFALFALVAWWIGKRLKLATVTPVAA